MTLTRQYATAITGRLLAIQESTLRNAIERRLAAIRDYDLQPRYATCYALSCLDGCTREHRSERGEVSS